MKKLEFIDAVESMLSNSGYKYNYNFRITPSEIIVEFYLLMQGTKKSYYDLHIEYRESIHTDRTYYFTPEGMEVDIYEQIRQIEWILLKHKDLKLANKKYHARRIYVSA